ncbi:hypothetical protein BU14_0167s0008 [Porphyra umbilicalis]|uniref:Uncharacterized protein n=1 Tax=Porphyra umbilicalis TaxID=2786 RepID=A0A1X6P8H6_PORUM|nr:hypothetical protein BU14_0167s0008 [Porphyra umbilicalis]|eukprot:OSX76933.1 hypothetical protein BU14_0167s0008 [Porphyra umbilicalis]
MATAVDHPLPGAAAAKPLGGRVYVVTGATRGVGRGIAIGLGEAGATVLITGRTGSRRPGGGGGVGGSLEETAADVVAAGGTCHTAVVDHGDDAAVAAFWTTDVPRLAPAGIDGLINNAGGGGDDGGDRPAGVIVNVGSIGGVMPLFDPLYGVGKVAVDRLTADCAAALKAERVAMLSFWPGMVSTEKMVSYMGSMDASGLAGATAAPPSGQRRGAPSAKARRPGGRKVSDGLATAESPVYVGRCVAALLGWPAERLLRAAGGVVQSAEVGRRAGVVDEKGARPTSYRSLRFLATAAVGGGGASCPTCSSRGWSCGSFCQSSRGCCERGGATAAPGGGTGGWRRGGAPGMWYVAHRVPVQWPKVV